MLSKITEQEFKDLLLVQVGSSTGNFIKIEDTERIVFPGTVKRSVSWQEGSRFFAHKSLTTGRQGQKPSPVFDHSQIQEVFPIEVKSTLFLTESEIKLRDLYEDGSLV
jgi:hypothetical protein